MFRLKSLQIVSKMSKQAEFTLGGCFNGLKGLPEKIPLRSVAEGLSWRQRVASAGSPKITKTDNFTAVKPPNAV